MADYLKLPRDAVALPTEADVTKMPFRIPPGYGMRSLPMPEWKALLQSNNPEELFDRLLVWESPRKGFLYVVSVDVSSGIGLDRSVIDVTRVGTVREPDEQVAQFVTSSIEPDDLAFYIEPIGRLYQGRNQMPALVAIECNGLGLGTQSKLYKDLGYPNVFVWQILDARDLSKTYTTRLGWWTSQRSRPLMLTEFVHAVKTVDPVSGLPDYRLNSPLTLQELATFVSPGPLWMAEAAEGANDDCVMAAAIGVHVAQTLQEPGQSGRETVHETRRRIEEESARLTERRRQDKFPVSAQNTDITASDLMGGTDLYETDPHAF